MIVRLEKELQKLQEGGKRLAFALDEVARAIVSGVRTIELNDIAERIIREGGDVPAFLNYRPNGASAPYPATLCVSVNDEVVHGIPSEKGILKEGDIVGIDLGLRHNGLFVDMAVTVPVGAIDASAVKLIETTRNALNAGIAVARAGGYIGDIGNAIEKLVDGSGFSIVRELGGHGVGRAVHEDPYIANFGSGERGERIVAGMVLAIEPMLNEGGHSVVLSKQDKYTFRTKDGKRSAHFEHTILVTDGEPEILTAI